MFGLIKRVFSKKDKETNQISKNINSSDLTMKYLKEELLKRKYFNDEKIETIYNHLINDIDLNKSDNFLSIEDKKELEINTRLKITKELMEIFNIEDIKGSNPKKLLQNLNSSVFAKVSRYETLIDAKQNGIKEFRLMNCNDERDCKWSKTLKKKKFSTDTDINKIIEENCNAEYCRCIVMPIVEF